MSLTVSGGLVDYRKSEKSWSVQLFPIDQLFFKHLLSALWWRQMVTFPYISKILIKKKTTHIYLKREAVSSCHEFLWHFKSFPYLSSLFMLEADLCARERHNKTFINGSVAVRITGHSSRSGFNPLASVECGRWWLTASVARSEGHWNLQRSSSSLQPLTAVGRDADGRVSEPVADGWRNATILPLRLSCVTGIWSRQMTLH